MPDALAPVIWVALGALGGTLLTVLAVTGVATMHIVTAVRRMHTDVLAGRSGIDWTDDTDLELARLLQDDA